MTSISSRTELQLPRSAPGTQLLVEVEWAPVTLGPREDLFCEGAAPDCVYLVLDGWACGYKTLDDGRRQIVSFLLPGDFCDFHMVHTGRMDHSVGTLTTVSLARFPTAVLRDLDPGADAITRLLAAACVEAAIQREWTVSLGRRSAVERLGHLFCEIFTRLKAGAADPDPTCEFPITQSELGDALGLSTVHVNRSLQELRGAGLLELKGRMLTMIDFERLKRLSKFNADYLSLHTDRGQARA